MYMIALAGGTTFIIMLEVQSYGLHIFVGDLQ